MNALILFTKIPALNFSKTRLQKILTPNECVTLSLCFIKDLVNKFSEEKAFDVFFVFTPKDRFYVVQNFIPSHFKIFAQVDGNIGEKMYFAMKKVFEYGYEKVTLIGSDIPSLTQKIVSNSFDLLEKNDLAFGPTVDGGYYLVASNKKVFTKEVFSLSINWSTKAVLSDSLKVLNQSNFQIALTETLTDIDTAKDLIRLIKNLKDENENPETAKFLNEKFSIKK